MKKPLRIFTVLYAAAAVCGCSVEDAFYDEVIDDPGYYVFNNAYPWQVANFFRCAEMADFFTAYRGIKEDRDASEKLADRYFGESWSELFYEKIVIPGIGTLYYVDDGVYSFYPSFYPDWDSADYCMDVKMEAGYMKISSSSGTFPAEARMSVENGVVNMDYLSSVYREKGSGYTMTVSTEGTSGTVSMPMCGSDGFSYVPQSGELAVAIDGAKVSDRFKVLFGQGRTGVSREGSPVLYFAPPAHYQGYGPVYR
ncbi:MAG: hypothetical protein IAB82_05955 [Bacteroidetes bacterium]|uniref:Lipoprotein n=1 Tax=Candidatus Cryptobacteroides faecavium TaxID=2840762 RepID=A0A9D9IER4_9BACT|nr:hypothetical protein [Candidatus Cryptobacteroides faecavium]